MKSKATRKFWKLYEQLSDDIQIRSRKVYQIWKANPAYPSLHFKKVDEEEPVYSVRIGDDYRAVGILEDNTIIWYWIGNHDDYLRLLRQ